MRTRLACWAVLAGGAIDRVAAGGLWLQEGRVGGDEGEKLIDVVAT